MRKSLKEMIVRHVKAEGPVSIDSICNYLKEQGYEHDKYFVSYALNELIRGNKVELYETGDSFVCRDISSLVKQDKFLCERL